MGITSSPHERGPVTPKLRAITPDLVQATLSVLGYQTTVDQDGDIEGQWSGRTFQFLTYGTRQDVLQVRGLWNELADENLKIELQEFCNDWNRERIWPKVYFVQNEDDRIRVVAEVATDLEFGVTDAQLRQFIYCALSTSEQFFIQLDTRFAP